MHQAPSPEQIQSIMNLVAEARESSSILDDGKLRELFTRARDIHQGTGDEQPARLLQYEVEAWSLMLHEQQTPDSSQTFGGMMGFTDGTQWPDLQSFPREQLDHLQERASASHNPAIKARYYEICWEKQGNHHHGRLAIKAYLDIAAVLATSTDSVEKWDVIQALSRSLVIAHQLHDNYSISESVIRIIKQLEFESVSENPRFVIELAEALVHRAANFPNALQVAKNALEVGIRVFDQNHNPMLVQSAIDVLIKVHRQLRSPEQDIVDVQVRRLLSLVQEAANSETHLGAMHFYQEALIYLSKLPKHVQRQWKDDLEKRLTEQVRLSDSQFATFSTEIDIDTPSLDTWLATLQTLKPAARYACLRDSQLLVPDVDQIRRSEQETKEEIPLLHLLSHQPIQDERIADSSTTPEDIFESNVVRSYQLHLQVYSYRFDYLIHHLRQKNRLSKRSFVKMLNQSDILNGMELGPLQHALTRYFMQDYRSAVPLLILEAERAFRHIAKQLGESITKTYTKGKDRRTGTSDCRNLDELLALPQMISTLGANNFYFLRHVLTERRGLSLRHETAHGALDPKLCNVRVANMLFYIYLWLTGFKKQRNDGSSFQCTAI